MSVLGTPPGGPSALHGVLGYDFETFNQPPIAPPISGVTPPNDNIKIPFAPSALTPFQFQAILDGIPYTVIITWNLFGRRYYVNIYTLQGILILCIARIASPMDYDINLVAGYFTSVLIWRPDMNWFEVSPLGTGDGLPLSPNVATVIAAAQGN